MSFAPYPIDPVLTAVVNGYKKQSLIADLVLPRTNELDKPTFEIHTYNENQFMYVPDTRIGRTGEVNRIEFGGSKTILEVYDYAIGHDYVPKDFEGVKNPESKKAKAAEVLVDIISLGRELRVANMLRNPAVYGGSAALPSELDDDTMDLTMAFEAAIDKTYPRANVMVIGNQDWRKCRRNKRLLADITRAVGDKASGRVTKEELAELLGLQNIIIGEAHHVLKNDEQAAKVDAWTGFIAFIYQDSTTVSAIEAGFGSGATFGFTGHYRKFSNVFQDPSKGVSGVETVRVVDQCREVICMPRAGFQLITL